MDENKEKSNISLPTGCMISKTSFVADTKNDEKEEKKKVKGKNNKDTKKKTIFFVIVAVIVASVFGVMDYLKSNKKSDKNGNSTIISTSQGTQTPNDATKSDGEENTEDIKQNVDVHPITEVPTTEDVEITTEGISLDYPKYEEEQPLTTENNTIADNQNKISIGGIDVSYEFDDTWTSSITDGAFTAQRSEDGKILSLYVVDSYIAIGKTTNIKNVLSGTNNPFKDNQSYVLSESKECEKIEVKGRVSYITYYSGTDDNGNKLSSIGLIQDIGGNTYAYITIYDTYGYDIQTLLDSLSVNGQ